MRRITAVLARIVMLAGTCVTMTLGRGLLSALAASTALFMVASTSAQAAWQTTTPDTTSTAFCSGVYTNIPSLRFKECIHVSSVTGGAWVSSTFEVINVTRTPRWITAHTGTVVSGRVQPRTNCGNLLLQPATHRVCTQGTRNFVLDGGYAYARGWVKDLSSGSSSWAYSPVYRP